MSYFYWLDRFYFPDTLSKRTYKYVKEDENEVLAVNVAGFSRDDIQVEVKNDGESDYLYITANPKDEVKAFVEPLKMRFGINANVVDEISCKVENGLLLVTVKKKDNKPNVNVKFQ
jgi:HSP20 family molecular chaperone IbpA